MDNRVSPNKAVKSQTTTQYIQSMMDVRNHETVVAEARDGKRARS